MSIEKIYGQWLIDEQSNHQVTKFPHDSQIQALKSLSLTAEGSFGGNASSYWKRAKILESDKPEDEQILLMRTQLIGKLTPSITALWRTMRTHDKDSYDGSDIIPISDIEVTAAEEGPEFIKKGFHELLKEDFYDTQLGMGIGWYSERLKNNGLPRTNLGKVAELIRIRDIYLDAARISLAQFEICYEKLGTLPKGGLSSGNIEIWTP